MLPMPARYVIDQDGVVAYAEVNPDYTNRPDPSELAGAGQPQSRPRRRVTTASRPGSKRVISTQSRQRHP